jgi:uncharacterized protein
VSGERDLGRLLADLRPEVAAEPYVFAQAPDGAVPGGVTPFATVAEDEGLTLVVTRDEADRLGLAYDYVAARITLRVHSDPAAVGMTAAFSRVLADAGMSCNVIAGFFHDHLLVPWERSEEAVRLLRSLGQKRG